MVVCGDDWALVIDEAQFDNGEAGAGRDLLRPRIVLGDLDNVD
jgi:hypothetical protein